ncbi:MAG: FkbM family methyltransferase [Gemmatimonadales bacterium]
MRWLADEVAHLVGGNLSLELRAGWVLRCHPAARRVYIRAQIDDPAQAAELDEFVSQCSPGMVLLDLGAHFGVFSLAALHYGGPHSFGVAVDPSRVATRMIMTQARLNGATERLGVVRAAVADTVGSREMLDVGVLADGYLVDADDAHPERDFVTVPAVTVDSLVDDLGRQPTHIKIDVEGFEAAVLRGAQRTLSTEPRPMLFIELHNAMLRERGDDPGETLQLLSGLGYDDLRVAGRPTTPAALLSAPLARVVAVAKPRQQPDVQKWAVQDSNL